MEKPQLSQTSFFTKRAARSTKLLNHLIAVAIYDDRRPNCKAKSNRGDSELIWIHPKTLQAEATGALLSKWNSRKWTNEWNSCGLLWCPVMRVLHMQWIQTHTRSHTHSNIQTHTRGVYTRQPLGGATLRRTNTSTFSLSRGARDKIKTTKYIHDPKETIWCSRLDGWRPADHLDSGSAMETHATRDDCNFTAQTGRTWTNWN